MLVRLVDRTAGTRAQRRRSRQEGDGLPNILSLPFVYMRCMYTTNRTQYGDGVKDAPSGGAAAARS